MLTERVEARTSRAPSGAAWWMISRCEGGKAEVLTISRNGKDVLPLFSHEEEAELFLWSAGPGDGWRARESRRGEILSLLCGPCSTLERVALDPLPEPWTVPMLDLFCLNRKDFVRTLLNGRGAAIGG